jgi:hypothetical protein
MTSKICFASVILLCSCAVMAPRTETNREPETVGCLGEGHHLGLPGSAVAIRIANVAISDQVYGRGNGDRDFDYGELVGIAIVIQNAGNVVARRLDVELVSNAPRMFVLRTGMRHLENLEPGIADKANFKVESLPVELGLRVTTVPLTVRIWNGGRLLLETPLPLEMNSEPPVGEYEAVRNAAQECADPELDPVPSVDTAAATQLGPNRTPAIVTLGLGAIALGAAIGVDALARSTYRTYERDPLHPRDILDSANNQRHLANVIAALGVSGISAGIWLYFRSEKARSPASVSVAPAVGSSFLGVTASRRY